MQTPRVNSRRYLSRVMRRAWADHRGFCDFTQQCLAFLYLDKKPSLKRTSEQEGGRTCTRLRSKQVDSPVQKEAPMASSYYLSARTSKGLVPRDQLRTIQAESIAARKPRAIPVPIGQKGCKGEIHRVKVTHY